MNYISAKDTANKWGITKARVIILAREGRIPGAMLVGNSWMIPEEARKPEDRRSKSSVHETSAFRFPLLTFCPYAEASFFQTLSPEEKKLLDGQCAFEACRYDEAYTILKDLLFVTKSLHIRIGALYYLCIHAIFSNNTSEFQSYMGVLKSVFEIDFPHKDELRTLFLDIDSLYLGNDFFISNFQIAHNHTYTPDVIPYLSVQTAFYDALNCLNKRIHFSCNNQLLLCQKYEQEGYPVVAQRLHLYLAMANFAMLSHKEGLYNLNRAIEIGLQYQSFHVLTVFAPSLSVLDFEKISAGYDPHLTETLYRYGKEHQKNVVAFIGSNTASTRELLSLSEHQTMLLRYAVKGLTNKQVAELTGIPEYTVRRQYESLLNHFNVGNGFSLSIYKP